MIAICFVRPFPECKLQAAVVVLLLLLLLEAKCIKSKGRQPTLGFALIIIVLHRRCQERETPGYRWVHLRFVFIVSSSANWFPSNIHLPSPSPFLSKGINKTTVFFRTYFSNFFTMRVGRACVIKSPGRTLKNQMLVLRLALNCYILFLFVQSFIFIFLKGFSVVEPLKKKK